VESIDPDPFSSSWGEASRNRVKQVTLGISSVLATILIVTILIDPESLKQAATNIKDAWFKPIGPSKWVND